MLCDASYVIYVAWLVYVTFSIVLCTLREMMKQIISYKLHIMMKQCCNNGMEQIYFWIFPTKHDPQMEQKQTKVFNNRVLWTYRIMEIWEETVANFCILPVWTLIAQKFFSTLL